MRDRTAFAFGVLALVLSFIALWTVYGEVRWRAVVMGAPAVLIVIAIGVLLLSRRHH